MKRILVPALLVISTLVIGYISTLAIAYATENEESKTTTRHYLLDGLPVYSMIDGEKRFDASAVIAAILNKLEAGGEEAEKPIVEIKVTDDGKALAITHSPDTGTKIAAVIGQIRDLSPHHEPEEMLFGVNATDSTVHSQDANEVRPETDLQFDMLGQQTVPGNFYRSKVPGGWIVAVTPLNDRQSVEMIFVPDAEHSWDGKSLK